MASVGCLSLALAAACDDAPPAMPSGAALDSIARVSAWGEVPDHAVRRLAALPVRVPGDDQSPVGFEFHQVAEAVVLASGAIAVGDGGSLQVVALDHDGDVLWRQGGRGMGPGEYREITGVSPHPAGGVAILDGNASRVTVVSSAGEVMETLPLPPERRGRFRVPVWLSDGDMVVGLEGPSPGPLPRDTLYRRELVIARILPGGPEYEVIGTVPGAESFETVVLGFTNSAPPPYQRNQGYGAAGDHLIVGPDDSSRVEVWDRDGSVRQRISAAVGTIPFTEADFEAFTEAWERRSGHPSARMRAAADTVLSRMPVPEDRLLLGPVRVDQTGRIWIPEAQLAFDQPELWWVVGLDGRVQEAWFFPPDTEFLTADRNVIVTRATGELGVELVQIHERTVPEAPRQ